LQRKITNPNAENKMIEIENRFKEFFEKENAELRKKIDEKNDIVNNLNEKNRTYETVMKDYSQEIEKIKKKASEIPVEEIKKKDELIGHLKEQLEQKEKAHIEEQQLVSSLFHQVALQYMVLKSKVDEGGKAINI
jgi:chromosome segregation ATPase